MQPTPAANEYLKTKVMTASPQELRLMLYDGAIKYCHQAMNAIEVEDLEENQTILFDRLRTNEKWIAGAGAVLTAGMAIVGIVVAVDALSFIGYESTDKKPIPCE